MKLLRPPTLFLFAQLVQPSADPA